MERVTNGTGGGNTELGRRFFSPLESSHPAVADFAHEPLSEVGLDGEVGKALSTASLHAFSLFVHLGMDHEDIRVIGRTAEGRFIVEMTNGLDFHVALNDEVGRLQTTNYHLLSLIALLDEVHVGRTEDGRSFLRLAVEFPE